jgi:outer membrane protein
MNKIKVLIVAAILFVSAGSAMAQKHGYIRVDAVVGLMPETAKLDSLLRKYQSDSLNPQFAYMVQEYNRKDSIANGKDSLKTATAVRQQIRQELEGISLSNPKLAAIAKPGFTRETTGIIRANLS